MKQAGSLVPRNWTKRWERTAPKFKVPHEDDPTMLPAVAAQQALAYQVLEYLRDRHEVATSRIAEMRLGPGGIETALRALPYAGFSQTISDALAGRRLITFDVLCELLAVLGPDVVPTTSALFEAMEKGIQSVEVWPAPGRWAPRQTRLVTPAGAKGGVNYATGAIVSSEPERPHPDGDVAIAGLLIELREAIDAWGGPGTTDGLEVEVDVYVGQASANLVVVNDAITGQMWLPADWGVRIAEEVRGPVGVFVLDMESEQDVAGQSVPLYRVVAPLRAFDPQAWGDNTIYLDLGDGVAKVWQDVDGGGIEWMPLGRE